MADATDLLTYPLLMTVFAFINTIQLDVSTKFKNIMDSNLLASRIEYKAASLRSQLIKKSTIFLVNMPACMLRLSWTMTCSIQTCTDLEPQSRHVKVIELI